jgi:hypothetical protein
MIGKLTAYVLRNKALVLLGLAVFVGFGIESYRELPVEAYPDVTNVEVQVITVYPGHAAEEVERQVTIPIESVMNGIPGRVSMRSGSPRSPSSSRTTPMTRRSATWRTSSWPASRCRPAPTRASRRTRRRSARSTATP